MKFSSRFLPLVAAALTLSTAALARTIEVPQAEFGSITPEQRKELENQLKQNKILQPEDSLQYSGSDIDQKNLDAATIAKIVITVGPIVCKWVVEAITDVEKASCKGSKTAKDACIAKVDSNADAFLGLCGIINITGKK